MHCVLNSANPAFSLTLQRLFVLLNVLCSILFEKRESQSPKAGP